ncbi:MAG TPA: helix-turn-helix transcriptional regulator [Stellaceae bacterium]|nr:helix-turn-helix transcriptional regulator [Stellaceae bacterium]
MAQKPARRHKQPASTDLLVGNRLRYARQLTGTSEAALARILGVSVRTIKDYESGRRRLGAVHLAATAAAIEVSLAFFFEEDLPVMTLEAGDPTVLTPKEAYILRQFRSLERDRQDEIFELVQLMVQPNDCLD